LQISLAKRGRRRLAQIISMKQLTQKLKSGKIQILDVPLPDLGPGMLLVRSFYSLISAGTEGSTVKAARKGYIGKTKERPQQVKPQLNRLRRFTTVKI